MSTALHCDGCGAWFGYGTEHRCSPVQFTTATNAVGMSPPPTPTPPEGWEERTEWGVRAQYNSNWVEDVAFPDEEAARKHTQPNFGDKFLGPRRVWVEPWREAE